MRYAIRSCYDQRSHSIHVSPPTGRPETRYICGGNYAGDRRIRDAESLADLVDALDREEKAPREDSVPNPNADLIAALAAYVPRSVPPFPNVEPIEPDEPDYDADYEADRLADRYERNVLGF